MNKNTIVINLFGSPGTGKSTLMAEIFQKLKWLNIDCEMAPEFAKELVWENRMDTLKDQIYVFSKQNHNIYRLNGKVDIIITDSPILLSILYHKLHHTYEHPTLYKLIHETFDSYNNWNFLLKRTKPYNTNGRFQTEHESDQLYNVLVDLLDEMFINYSKLDSDMNTSDKIVDLVVQKINENL